MREALKLEETTLLFPRVVHNLGIGGAQHADAIAQLADVERPSERNHKSNPGNVTFADVGPRGAGECVKATRPTHGSSA